MRFNVKTTVISSALVLATAALTGCADELVGRWEAKSDSTIDLEIAQAASGWSASGHIYVGDNTGTYLCPFEADFRDNGDDRFEVSGHFTNQCSNASPFDAVQCTLKSPTLMKCEFGSLTMEYEKN
ncbi:MAG: hypothetical protein U0414_06400 [Polyangiaceae bacterium]